MANSMIQTVAADRGELPPMPIEPTWIREGAPDARGCVLVQSDDRRVSTGLWSCTAGVFRWEFTWDEFVHVLEGEATITDEEGNSCTLRAGDTAHFPVGLNTEWRVDKFIRKVFTIRTREPLEL